MSKRIDAEYFRDYRAGKKPSLLDSNGRVAPKKLCGTCGAPSFRATCDKCREARLTKERSSKYYVNRYVGESEKQAMRQARTSLPFDAATFRKSMERARALGLIRERGKV